jgi:hypothetical protein
LMHLNIQTNYLRLILWVSALSITFKFIEIVADYP